MSLTHKIRRALKATDDWPPLHVHYLGGDDYEIEGRAPSAIREMLGRAGLKAEVRKVTYGAVIVAVTE